MKQTQKTLALWLMIILLGMVVLHFVQQKPDTIRQVSFSEFMDAVNADNVDEVTIQNDEYHGVFKKTYQEGAAFQTMGPASSEKVLTALADHKVKTEFKPAEDQSFWQHLLISWLPLILLFGLFFFSMRQIQAGGGKAMSFGRSKARLLVQNEKKVTFEDVAGIDEARDELEEIIAFLKDPKRFTRLGGRIPKGVLLMGSPGTGKTLLARAIAGEANAPFFSISGSDFVEMFVGVGAARVRDLFEQGKRNAPCIIFIDEIDAVGRHRGAGLGGGHDEREQTLNQLLVEMDGFESNEGVIIIAATNRPDVLDPALLRPGRFDRRIIVPRPDVRGREGILKIHARKLALAPNVDFKVIARGTPGFSGADLANVVNEAALLAARIGKTQVGMHDMELAKDKVLMGSERRSLMITDDEKKNTAYHEAGHAMVAKLIPGTDPIHKVTIIPRGQALGVTQQLPTDDRFTQNRGYCENTIAMLMGGRCAEELIFDQPTTGAGNDIERATELARKMVCEWGMSEKMGPLTYGKKEEMLFLGKELAQHKDYSESTANMIDEEVKRIVMDNYKRAKDLLASRLDTLHAIAKALLDRESLDTGEIETLMQGGTLPPLPAVTEPKSKSAAKEADVASADAPATHPGHA
ncbi:MAG: cell division protein FtsH [Deltaproteobacteria bacterium CG11_big_fil_rev_8_21_14_0_20_47_16]|nr:MAG: cell division protein FtsH [Deltaproteobacteria bacterium CG11_big_fil_rev_8_21_14_0_20_47_16]